MRIDKLDECTRTEEMEKLCCVKLENPTPDEADLQGEWAYSFGRDYEDNPYIGDPVWESWAEGWRRGEENNEG